MSPGRVAEVFGYRHDLEQFVSEGLARVSNDGSVLVTDPGSGLSVSGWHYIPPPPPPQGGACNCSDPSPCVICSCVNGVCIKTRNIPAGQSCHSVNLVAELIDRDPDASSTDYVPVQDNSVFAGSSANNSDVLKITAQSDPSVAVNTYTWTVTGPNSSSYAPPSTMEWDVGTISPSPGQLDFHVTVQFADGETSNQDLLINVGLRTDEITVVGWINPQGVTANPSGVRSDVLAYFPPPPAGASGLGVVQKTLTLGYLGVLSAGLPLTPTAYQTGLGLGLPGLLSPLPGSLLSSAAQTAIILALEKLLGINIFLGPADTAYILNWQFYFAGNSCPGHCPPLSFANSAAIDNFGASQITSYKLLNRLQIKYLVDASGSNYQGGSFSKILQQSALIGTTIDPIFGLLLFSGVPGPKNNYLALTNGNTTQLVNEGSPDSKAVAAFNTLGYPLKWNDIGSRIVLSVALGTGKQVVAQVYPTYNIYTNGQQADAPIVQAPQPIQNFNLNPYYITTPFGPAPFLVPQ